MSWHVRKKDMEKSEPSFPNIPTKILAEMALMIALSGALHLIKLITLPQGGSVTLGSMTPIILFSLRRGPKLAVLAGIIFGLIVLIEEPFIYHLIQLLLDYPIAFGFLGLAGLFKKMPLIGVGIAIAGRFFAHFLSGIIFFASFTPEGINPVVYSIMYNGSYLGIEFIISGILIFSLINRNIFKIY